MTMLESIAKCDYFLLILKMTSTPSVTTDTMGKKGLNSTTQTQRICELKHSLYLARHSAQTGRQAARTGRQISRE